MASHSIQKELPIIQCKRCRSLFTPVQHKTRKILASISYSCPTCRRVFDYHNWPCLLAYLAFTGSITFFLMQYLFQAILTGKFTYLISQDSQDFAFVFTQNIKEKFIILAVFLGFLLTIYRFMVHFRELIKRTLEKFLETESQIR